MEQLTTIAAVRAAVAAARARGERVGFVPTMGALHAGHASLVERARREAGFVIVSVFVNPLQFGAGEDLARYPRDAAGDAATAARAGADALFLPGEAEMYPRPMRVAVVPGALAERWEGAVRPGHFAGVCTVVLKLLNVVQPDVAVFGQKDAQQAVIVQAMVEDLALPVRIVVAPTVRADDGVALSSRNAYLSADERAHARALSRALQTIQAAFEAGERSGDRLHDLGARALHAEPGVMLDYLAVADPHTLEPRQGRVEAGDWVLVAARVGETRLIDNLRLA